MKYKKAPPGWSYTDKNPFTPDGQYGLAWSSFCILDREDDQIFTGRSGEGPFSARFGRKAENLEEHLIDFLRYENAHDRWVILSFPQDMDIDVFVARALSKTPLQNRLRPDDPKIILHSTTLAAWKGIMADGAVKAASRLGLERGQAHHLQELTEINLYYQNEPPEYADYIMFGRMDCAWPEMVLASNKAGRFMMDENEPYEPGVRLYFDNQRIIQDGLGVRDGLHLIKVFGILPLEPYLLAAIGVNGVDPEGKVAVWTPGTFYQKADEVFRNKFPL